MIHNNDGYFKMKMTNLNIWIKKPDGNWLNVVAGFQWSGYSVHKPLKSKNTNLLYNYYWIKFWIHLFAIRLKIWDGRSVIFLKMILEVLTFEFQFSLRFHVGHCWFNISLLAFKVFRVIWRLVFLAFTTIPLSKKKIYKN